ADKRRLDAHLEGVFALQQRLKMTPAPPQSSCVQPAVPSSPTSAAERSKVMGDLVAMALACDLTRVVTFEFSSPASQTIYDAYPTALSCGGSPQSFHEYEHCAGIDGTVTEVLKYFVDQFSVFVQGLKGTSDGAETLLDSSCVLGTSEIAYGPTHETT